MTRNALVASVLGLLLMMIVVASVLLQRRIQNDQRLTARLLAVRRAEAWANRADGAIGRGGIMAVIAALGAMVARSGLLPRGTQEQVQQSLNAAGLRGARAPGMFIGFKLLLLVGLPLATLIAVQPLGLSPLAYDCAVAGAAIGGLLAPDWWVNRKRFTYRRAVLAGLPDALDMMVLCAEAGLGLEPALSRVGHELQQAHPEMSGELARTVVELRVVGSARVALVDLGTRTGLESLKRVASTLAQTLQYGTPLGQALRVLSAELRQETLVRFEARAARLPVLLTLPMILFILPCVFLIVGGPAVLQVVRTLHP